MPRFKIFTPVPGYTGLGAADTQFSRGEAIIDTADSKAAAALYYFKGAGYRIVALDDESVSDVLHSSDPEVEARALRAEIQGLKDRKAIAELKAERDKLREELELDPVEDELTEDDTDDDSPERGEGATLVVTDASGRTEGDGPDETVTPATELLAPPAENAPVDEWRTWVIASNRGTEKDVKGVSRADIIARFGADYDRERDAQLKGGAA